MSLRRLITVADDFGLSPAVNEAVESAARDGILTSASLMVGAPHAADAVRRAKSLDGRLKVGLHLVVIEGPAVLPPSVIPNLVDDTGQFPSLPVLLGFRYAFLPRVRRQLYEEISAQYLAFSATGLTLDHVNAHKHMHLHPVVGAMAIQIGLQHGLRAMRVPAEPPQSGAALSDRMLYRWTHLLRRQARVAGLLTNDHVAGLHRSGHMTPSAVQDLIDTMPAGLTEMYFHPATASDAILRRTMKAYEHHAEWQALLHTRLPPDISLTSYSELRRPGRDVLSPPPRPPSIPGLRSNK